MQRQYEISDCGLFAAAVSTAVAYKANPSEHRWEQSNIHSYVSRCLSNQILTLFPTLYTGMKQFAVGEQ